MALLLSGLLSAPAAARVYDRVEVRGAQFVPERDIRLTCGAAAGIDYFDAELRAIEECLMSTGVFDAVRLFSEADTLVIEVEETDLRPGRVEGSVMYDSQDEVTLGFSFERYNLFPGTFGAFHVDIARQARRLDAGLYRSDAFGETLDAGLDLAGYRTEYDDLAYHGESLRGAPLLAWTPSEDLRIEAGAGWRRHRMSGVETDASALLRQEAGTVSAPYLRLGLDYAPRGDADEAGDDGRPAPAVVLGLDQYLWNLGHDAALSETRLRADAQMALGGAMRLLAGLGAGRVQGLTGRATRAVDRFHPGADTFRGFAPRGIGPRDRGDALGANSYVIASLELQREIAEIRRHDLRAGVFTDIGSAWDLDDTLGGRIDDAAHLRATLGLSLAMDLDGTPASLYLARPVLDEPGDRGQVFGLSVSLAF
ncbi:BamA/TamA family outer membrane protein [Mangrovicoccus sp. HB182678]|uniref:BamA/TamA family outer membrane protein n=2 Tax=Mangrovicoccus algicola TaxID=2771008 RepID=A0A8J6Z836_9RHOB|nr:BamA/TamA family outer membrane protein [Mangrovicoccus algicola]